MHAMGAGDVVKATRRAEDENMPRFGVYKDREGS
jgi:hypothetical protein